MVLNSYVTRNIWTIFSLISLLLALTTGPAVPSQAQSLPLSTLSISPPWAVVERDGLPQLHGGVYRVYYSAREQLSTLAIRFDIWEVRPEVKYAVMALDAKGAAYLMDQGYRLELDTGRGSIQPMGPSGYPCYRDVDQLYVDLQQIATDYPDLAELIDYGDSWRNIQGLSGYDLWVLKITNSQIEAPKPRFFLMANIHARELTTPETAMYFVEHLLDNYGADPDTTWIVDYHEVYVIVTVNPDGRHLVEGGCLQRKNRNDDTLASCTLCDTVGYNHYGVDLNRNYPYHWGGASTWPCNAMYQGLSVASEPETYYLLDLVRSIMPDQRAGDDVSPAPDDTTGLWISLHSYGNLVLWPWSWTYDDAPNVLQLRTLGRKFAYFNSYTPQQASSLYATTGNATDWAYGELGIAAYTFELGESFFQPCGDLEQIMDENLGALLYAAKVPRTPYLTPSGPDALNLTVVPETVAVGETAQLTVTINDTRYNNSNGIELAQNIAGTEYYIDTPPWITTTVPISHPMTAADGSFDETIEVVTATVDTTDLSYGRHTLFVRGQDADGNWGPFSAAFLWVNKPASTLTTITVMPTLVTATVGVTRTFTVTGYDQYGDPMPITPTWTTNGGTVKPTSGMTTVLTAQVTPVNGRLITATQETVSGTAELHIVHSSAAAIELTPVTTIIAAGESQSYTVTARDAYSNTWDVGTLSTYTITPAAGGIWANNVYTAEIAGTWTITTTCDGLTDTAVLTVAHAPTATSAILSPAYHTVEAGGQVIYTLVATDTYGNSWDATASGDYTITPAAGGMWANNVYTAEVAGAWTITTTYNGLTDTAVLTVAHAPTATSAILSPAYHTVKAGGQVVYTLVATDTYGNSWDATASGNYAITPAAGGMWTNNVYTAEIAGAWTITTTYDGLTDTAVLTVAHAPTATIAILSPAYHTVEAGGPVVYTLVATDTYGNSWDATARGNYTITPAAGGSWTDNVYINQRIGTWTVTSTVTNAVASAVLTVTRLPVASFSRVPTSAACIGSAIQFTDTSSGNPITWSWTFGDGGTADICHPTHTYTATGIFTVTLTTTNTYGFDVTADTVDVISGPSVIIAQTLTENVCLMTNVVFSATNTGSTASYLWDFGDGVTATGEYASHAYAAPGTYTVWLTATNSCHTDAVSTTVTVDPPPISTFTRHPVDDVLIGAAVQFIDTSRGEPTAWLWNFGDASTSTAQYPVHTYTAAGAYTVTLTITGDCGSDSVSQTLNVGQQPQVSFTHIPTGALCVGTTVQFTDTSSGDPAAWVWTFGDGGIADTQHPTQVYTTAGTFTITLTVTNAYGSDVATGTVQILSEPSAAVLRTPAGKVCVGANVVFSAINSGCPASYLWNFGDSVTATGQHSNHAYAVSGTYTIWLTAINGCATDAVSTTITVASDPSASFVRYPAGDVPLGTSIHFTDTSSGGPTAWLWDFGDGFTSTLQHPDHVYTSTRAFTVALTIAQACGSDAVTGIVIVESSNTGAIIIALTSNSPVALGQTMHFTAIATGSTPITYSWGFGDGTSPVTGINLATGSHVYTSSGVYTAHLTIANCCGSDNAVLTVTVDTVPEFWYIYLPLVMRHYTLCSSSSLTPVAYSAEMAGQETSVVTPSCSMIIDRRRRFR